MTIINVCNLFAPIVCPLIGIINILIIILYLDLQKPMATRNEQTITKPVQTHLSYPPPPTLPQK